MEWINKIEATIVGIDTAPFIYFIEENVTYLPLLQPFFEAMERGAFTAVTSTLTLTEVLTHPLGKRNPRLAQEYRDILLGAAHLLTVDVTSDIAESAARLRAVHRIRTPDAIQIATAMEHGASFWLTNDKRLPAIPRLTTLLLDRLRPKT